MPFFKDLRRRSKASFRTQGSSNGSSAESNNDTMPTAKSSSTLNSSFGTTTPPSSIPNSASSPNLSNKPDGSMAPPPVPQRPTPMTSSSNRYSQMYSSQTNGSSKTPLPTSQFAARVKSIPDGYWAHQKILVISGEIGDSAQHSLDGNLTVLHHQGSFPQTSWPVFDSHFKALVYLSPGPNTIRLDFTSPKLIPTSPPHSSWITIHHLPLVNSPPLQLAILVGKDSLGTFDAVPGRIQREGNGLDMAIRKFRMAGHLWQAFTAEQMKRNNFKGRCFRFEEEWQTGTLSLQDRNSGQMRNETKIHIIRSEKTVAELRDLNLAQQNKEATDSGGLHRIATEDVKRYFNSLPGQKQYVSLLILDSHWDKKANTIRGHAALGAANGDIHLGIFGSHLLQSYPSCIDDVAAAFMDCTQTDTAYVANDCNEAGTNWEAANLGIGAHMHETGHLLGCPHQESGVMLRDYVKLNRTFVSREPFSSRTKSQGLRLCLAKDECTWHRLDVLRFRYHPCFRMPADTPLHSDRSVQVWAVDNGKLLVTAATGVAFIEIFAEGDEVCKTFIDYTNTNNDSLNNNLSRHLTLTENEIREKLGAEPPDRKKKRIKLEVHSAGQEKHTVEDLGQLLSRTSTVKMPNSRVGYKGSKLGFSQMDGSEAEELILWSSFQQKKLLTSIKVYHGFALDGIEFCYEDSTSQMFGKRGGNPGGSEFTFDTRKSEILLGFYVRAGLWIDGLQIITSHGRKSEIFGNPNGGSGHTLIPPRGYSIAGVSGSCGAWLDGFSLIITR